MDNKKIQTDQFLEHWGIKGQKWGLRRYQNPDGSLTEAGRKHYGYGSGDSKTQQKAQKIAEKRALKIAKEKAREKEKQQKIDAKKAAEFEKRKQEILKNPRLVYENYDRLTKEEIDSALTRFDRMNKLNEANKQYLEAGTNYINALTKWSGSALGLYNNVAKGFNVYSEAKDMDFRLPTVKDNQSGNKKKK